MTRTDLVRLLLILGLGSLLMFPLLLALKALGV